MKLEFDVRYVSDDGRTAGLCFEVECTGRKHVRDLLAEYGFDLRKVPMRLKIKVSSGGRSDKLYLDVRAKEVFVDNHGDRIELEIDSTFSYISITGNYYRIRSTPQHAGGDIFLEVVANNVHVISRSGFFEIRRSTIFHLYIVNNYYVSITSSHIRTLVAVGPDVRMYDSLIGLYENTGEDRLPGYVQSIRMQESSVKNISSITQASVRLDGVNRFSNLIYKNVILTYHSLTPFSVPRGFMLCTIKRTLTTVVEFTGEVMNHLSHLNRITYYRGEELVYVKVPESLGGQRGLVRDFCNQDGVVEYISTIPIDSIEFRNALMARTVRREGNLTEETSHSLMLLVDSWVSKFHLLASLLDAGNSNAFSPASDTPVADLVADHETPGSPDVLHPNTVILRQELSEKLRSVAMETYGTMQAMVAEQDTLDDEVVEAVEG